jgi:hypothetical protein
VAGAGPTVASSRAAAARGPSARTVPPTRCQPPAGERPRRDTAAGRLPTRPGTRAMPRGDFRQTPRRPSAGSEQTGSSTTGLLLRLPVGPRTDIGSPEECSRELGRGSSGHPLSPTEPSSTAPASGPTPATRGNESGLATAPADARRAPARDPTFVSASPPRSRKDTSR